MPRSSSFYFSFLALPRGKRRAIEAVFDFCRVVDDSVDLAADVEPARKSVDLWRVEVARVFEGDTPATPEGRRLQALVVPFKLPRRAFDDLVDGVEMDLVPRRYATFAELEIYCHRVASSVGLMCAAVFGAEGPTAEAYARDLGVALQLTNILRDVAVDFRAGRCYLPLEDLERFGCTEADIAAEVASAGGGVRSTRVRELLEHHASRAHEFFARADRAVTTAERARWPAAEIMRVIYADVLRRIEAARFDVFSSVIRAPRSEQARLAFATWWRLKRIRHSKPVAT
jgi:phytoene synthase